MDAAVMREHPLDGEMGLAGIGRPEHGGDAGAGRALAGRQRGRRRQGHDQGPHDAHDADAAAKV